MLSIHAELQLLVRKLDEQKIPYAVCGALALAVFGHPRATFDIDLLSLQGSADRILQTGRGLGFTLKAAPMRFAGGTVLIQRISKPDPASEDILSLDVLTLSLEIESQMLVEIKDWNGFPLTVVGKESLVALKNLRGNLQDRADIEKLS